jgi:hypothetical protein
MAKGSTTSTTQIRTSSRLRLKSRENHAHRSTRVRQEQPKSAKNPRTIVPPPQSARIVERFITGQSIREIAREEKRDRATVTKIVKGPEIQSYIQTLREKYYGALEIALDALLDELRNPNSRTRGWLAYEMLKDGGVVPSQQERETQAQHEQAAPENTERAKVKEIMSALIEGAIARHAAYGLRLPEIEDDLKKAGGKVNYETGRVEPAD